MKNKKQTVLLIIRVLLSVFFLSSSFFKLKSIDTFEIYIYSFNFFDLNFSFLVSRFVIAIELFIGFLLLFGLYTKKAVWVTISLLLIFTIFITYLLITENDEHCHCFGDFIEISHLSSILKNIILITLLLLIYKSKQHSLKFIKLIILGFLLTSILFPFIISPPDSFFYKKFTDKVKYDQVLLDSFINADHQYLKGKKILCFYSTGCRYCKLAAQKLSIINKKIESKEIIKYIFWGTDKSVNAFYKETKMPNTPYKLLDPSQFLKITNGKMPLIILLDEGIIKGKHNYRSINDNEIINFINK
jgi:uncharacterized membrane protein YphA (DoxX/SURF4 family)